MGKFTSQGKSYGAPPSRAAMAGSSIGDAFGSGLFYEMVEKKRQQDEFANKMKLNAILADIQAGNTTLAKEGESGAREIAPGIWIKPMDKGVDPKFAELQDEILDESWGAAETTLNNLANSTNPEDLKEYANLIEKYGGRENAQKALSMQIAGGRGISPDKIPSWWTDSMLIEKKLEEANKKAGKGKKAVYNAKTGNIDIVSTTQTTSNKDSRIAESTTKAIIGSIADFPVTAGAWLGKGSNIAADVVSGVSQGFGGPSVPRPFTPGMLDMWQKTKGKALTPEQYLFGGATSPGQLKEPSPEELFSQYGGLFGR